MNVKVLRQIGSDYCLLKIDVRMMAESKIDRRRKKINQKVRSYQLSCVLNQLLFSMILEEGIEKAKIRIKKLRFGYWKLEEMKLTKLP